MSFFNEERYVRQTVKCDNCPLNYRRKVWGEGSYRGGIVFLGEAPGKNEDNHERPFVGQSGRILNKALIEVGIKRLNEWTTNVINCRPPNNDYSHEDTKIALHKYCNEGLFEELNFLYEEGFKVIVPFGLNASRALGVDGSMKDIHGKEFTFKKYIVIPTYHPSYILRKGGVGTIAWYYWLEDFKKVKKELLLEVV